MSKLKKYLKKTQLTQEVESFNKLDKTFSMTVVIPVYGEYGYIARTLKHLSLNDTKYLNKTLILIVINNPEIGYDPNYVEENQLLLKELRSNNFQQKHKLEKLNLIWLDASSKEFELLKKGGVGMARKLGMDTALSYLDWKNDPLIISLDADTLVEKFYLKTIEEFFAEHEEITAASISYKHLPGETPEEEKAIRDYEFLIEYYVDKLNEAGSPYAYHTIGSAMACKADAYIKAGGMKLHRGGEDFYFMQALRKIGPIKEITDTKVYQSPRISNRVPFGTGPKMQEAISGKQIKIYNPKIFEILKDTLQKAEKWIGSDSVTSPDDFITSLAPDAKQYFTSLSFETTWHKILNHNTKNSGNIIPKERAKLLWAFYTWFDAFKTLKFVHFLEKKHPNKYPKISIQKFLTEDA